MFEVLKANNLTSEEYEKVEHPESCEYDTTESTCKGEPYPTGIVNRVRTVLSVFGRMARRYLEKYDL